MDDAVKVAQEDELIERIARALFAANYEDGYYRTASEDEIDNEWFDWTPEARAILPFIHEARIEGGKMVQDKIVEWLRVQQHGRTSDNYPGYYARRIEDGEWR